MRTYDIKQPRVLASDSTSITIELDEFNQLRMSRVAALGMRDLLSAVLNDAELEDGPEYVVKVDHMYARGLDAVSATFDLNIDRAAVMNYSDALLFGKALVEKYASGSSAISVALVAKKTGIEIPVS